MCECQDSGAVMLKCVRTFGALFQIARVTYIMLSRNSASLTSGAVSATDRKVGRLEKDVFVLE